MNNITPELEKTRGQIEVIAKGFGLDFFETIFQVVDFYKMNEVASYGGFPNRYPHWRFGMEYERMRKSYEYGLHKIYEIVINNNPCYAYLLQSNSIVDQKIVMAHVYAHCDFFKNNLWFSKTNTNMLNEMANHGSRIRKYIDKYGIDRIESFIDICLSIEDLIDYHSPFILRKKETGRSEFEENEEVPVVKKIASKAYMDRYINPKEFLEKQQKQLDIEMAKKKKIPECPERDFFFFLLANAPLEIWEIDVLSIIREESYYFSPQWQTKIMNEGWATYWHSKIMTTCALQDNELIDYADHHSGTLGTRPGALNPYKIGLELFRDIENRWNKGRFGKEYEECDNIELKKKWNKETNLGIKKIFEVRRLYNDITFIDEFLTKEFCEANKLFNYGYNERTGNYEIIDRNFEEIKKNLLFSLTNLGRPFISIIDANYENRGELLLEHKHEGIDLRIDYAKDTVKNIQQIWKRPVYLYTILNGKKRLISFDGKLYKDTDI